MRILNISLFSILLVSCVSGLPSNKITLRKIKEEVNIMYNRDQSIRSALLHNDSLFGMNLERGFILNKKKFLGNRFQVYQKKRDSLVAIMLEIDEENTNRLIDITSKYGFPSMRRLNEKKAKAYFLFVHSQKHHFERIRKLLDTEYQSNRISEYEYAYIQWHLNGRGSAPPMMGKDGKVVY